jgi:hypothetical protein
MVRYYPLDKAFKNDTDYTMEADKALLIQAIGTTDTGDVTIRIDGHECGVITKNIAPTPRVYDFDLPLLDLGDLFLVVPPDKTVNFDGTSSSYYTRCVGKLVELEPREVMPSVMADRFRDQPYAHRAYVSGSYATAGTWAAGTDITLLELVPKTIELYRFNDYVGIYWTITGTALSHGKAGIIFELNGKPFDNLLSSMAPYGIDAMSMYHPPTYNKNTEPFYLSEWPIEVPGDTPFVVKARNISGSNITIGSGEGVTVYMVCDYYRRP